MAFKAKTWEHDEKLVPSSVTDEGNATAEVMHARNFVWDPIGLAWVRATQAGAGGGGGAVTVADGADVAQGSRADAAWVSGSGTVIALLKKIASAGGSAVSIADGADVAQGTTTDASTASTTIGLLKAIKAAVQGTVAVSGTFWQATQPVSGTFWQATQPVSAVSLPTHGVTVADGADTAQGTTTDLSSANTVIGILKAIKAAVQGTLAVSGTFWQAVQPVSGTFWQATQPVSIAAMPSTPVTGTFWQATQPVSGAVSVSNLPTTQSVADTAQQTRNGVPVISTYDMDNRILLEQMLLELKYQTALLASLAPPSATASRPDLALLT